jgi:hypothetical protein
MEVKMMKTSGRSRLGHLALAASLTLGLGVGATVVTATSASAAQATFIATPNGMAGVVQEIVLFAPKLRNQVVILGFQINGVGSSLQTTMNATGYGSIAWTPSIAGSWTISGLGNAIALGTTTITVDLLPTQTILMAPNNVQQGVSNPIVAVVSASVGTWAPEGTITVRNANGNVVATGTLAQIPASQASQVTMSWTPDATSNYALFATFTPTDSASGSSVAPQSSPFVNSNVTAVALRFPPSLYVGEPTVLGAVLGAGFPAGAVAFTMNGVGITGSIGIAAQGAASTQWTPSTAGVVTMGVNYSANSAGPGGARSGTSAQSINVLPARAQDSITTRASNLGIWNQGSPEVLVAGGNTVLSGASGSGSPVIFSENGPCVIAGATLTALSAGQCVITATSPGNATLKPATETYVLSITAPPRKPARR